MTLRPAWGYCLIRPISTQRETKSGVVLPDTMPQGNTLRGTVIAVGKGSIALDGATIPMEFAPGNVVVFKKYEAEEVAVNTEKLYLVDQRQVMGVLDN